LKDQLHMLKHEIKEKDLDIIQLQKEINELQLENKLLKTRIPTEKENFTETINQDENKPVIENPYIQDLLACKKEKECAISELMKAQDVISKLKLEKSTRSIDLYDPNNPDILHKKISKNLKLNILPLF
jgi:hypothetical protein